MASSDTTVLRYALETVKGVTPDNSVKATGTLTGSANFANSETVTINGKVYTFESALTNVDGHVKVAASLALSLVNLQNAINLNGAGVPGTDYATATTEHPTVEAPATTATTLTARAKGSGTAGNALTTTEAAANAAWGAATLTGGANATGLTLKHIRYTGESINFNIENTKSAEITPSRVETDLIQTSAEASGDINAELSYGTFDDFIEAVMCGTWTADVLENGTILRSFLVQKHFTDMDIQQYHNYNGMSLEGWDLKMEIGKIVESTFSFMGFGNTPTEGQIGGATIGDPTDTQPMNAVTNVQDFIVDSVPYGGCINSLGLNLKNNIRAIQCLGSLAARDTKLGTLEVSGDMDLYFSDGSMYERFIQGLEFPFSFRLEDNDGNSYSIAIPRAKFESAEVVSGGKNSDVMLSGKWRGLLDGTSGNVIEITRDPA